MSEGYQAKTSKYSVLEYFQMLALLSLLELPQPVLAEVITGKEVQTGLHTWEWRESGVSVQFHQRLPDQTRAFFQGRGFSAKNADSIARACVFQTIFRNDGTLPLVYDMDKWQITYQGKRRSLLTREHWDGKWQEGETSQAALIALRWSLLPTRQVFEPGDYNWGMTSFGLPSGESFDLSLVLTIGGSVITGIVPAIICTPE